MTNPYHTLARKYHAFIKADNSFQRRARTLQSVWRSEQGYEAGTHGGNLLGSLIPMPWAEETLANYLTRTIGNVVRHEVDNPNQPGKLISKPRIFCNLLSSQPLSFNLFAVLQQDLALATRVFRELVPGRVDTVTRIEFEHSPGRGDPRYTGDKSAFDVYVEFNTPRRGRGFIGIEVKYHEDLGDRALDHKTRYDEIAETMGCFRASEMERLHTQPLQQIWRDHLLAGSLRQADEFEDGFFVFLYPKENFRCANAVSEYGSCLTESSSFEAWTIEQVCAAIQQHTSDDWIGRFIDRYLNFGKLDALI